jgi:hypothetical protein
MTVRHVRVGSLDNIHVYDDADFDGGIETDDVIKAFKAPVLPEDVLRLEDVGDLTGDVIGPATSTDNAIATFDGTTGKRLQSSLVLIDDTGDVLLPNSAYLSTDEVRARDSDGLFIKGHDTGEVTIYSSLTNNKGAKLNFFSAGHALYPGSMYLDIGDYTDNVDPGSEFHLRVMDNGVTTDIIVANISGNVGINTSSPSAYADLTLERGVLCIKETTTPTANADYGKVYTKSDNKLYFQDGAGTEHEVAFV